MKIDEMHVLFRQLGQQMGMQTVRNILPEEIDVCLNIAIDATIKRIIEENLAFGSNDIIVRANSKVGQINAIRTLYGRKNIDTIDIDADYNRYKFNIDCTDIMYITGVEIKYEEYKRFYECRICDLDTINNVLSDYCARPTYEYPVCTFETDDANMKVKVYTSSKTQGKTPVEGAIKIIRKPAVVSLKDDIDCDLPDFVHTDIVKLAVDTFNNSVAITTN